MCFYYDDYYDWYASVSEVSQHVSTGVEKCCECGLRIPQGEECSRLYLQQHESCRCCESKEYPEEEYPEDGDSDGETCDVDGCDYGETSTDYSCQRCLALRAAIRVVEESEGCTGEEAEPPHAQLYESMDSGEGRGHYAAKICAHGFIAEFLAMPLDEEDVERMIEDDSPPQYRDPSDGGRRGRGRHAQVAEEFLARDTGGES